MMQIDCPFCGRRDETEFNYGGEAHLTRPALAVSDEQWAEYLFFRNNVKGVHAERWRHTRGCGQWFNAVRNTATHRFLAFYRITEPRPDGVWERGVATETAASTASAAAKAPAEAFADATTSMDARVLADDATGSADTEALANTMASWHTGTPANAKASPQMETPADATASTSAGALANAAASAAPRVSANAIASTPAPKAASTGSPR